MNMYNTDYQYNINNFNSEIFTGKKIEETSEYITLKHDSFSFKILRTEWEKLENEKRTKIIFIHDSLQFFLTDKEYEKYKYYKGVGYLIVKGNNRQERKKLKKLSVLDLQNNYYLVPPRK